jgi:uncharacterized membrane protein YgcG
MKFLTRIGLTALLSAVIVPAYAQNAGCDAQIVDNAQVIKNLASIQGQVNELSALGADVRVRLLNIPMGSNLDVIENQMESDCTSWRSGNGVGRKSNLVAFVIGFTNTDSAGKRHGKVGMYPGAVFPMLAKNWPQILSEDMTPALKRGDWSEGLYNGIQSASTTIRNSRTVSQYAGAKSVVINNKKPVDYTPAVIWTLIVCGFFFLVWLLWKASASYFKTKDQKAMTDANQRASKFNASRAINSLRSTIQDAVTLGKVHKVTLDLAQSKLDAITSDYSQLTDDSPTRFFDEIKGRCLQVENLLEGFKPEIVNTLSPVPENPKNVSNGRHSPWPTRSSSIHDMNTSRAPWPTGSKSPEVSKPEPPVSHVHNTTIINERPNYDPYPAVIPILVPVSVPEERYTPTYEAPTREESSYGGSSNFQSSKDDDDDSSSGGSMSFDSDSSDSGSSDSGSSDSGGSDDF